MKLRNHKHRAMRAMAIKQGWSLLYFPARPEPTLFERIMTPVELTEAQRANLMTGSIGTFHGFRILGGAEK